jgi:alkylhydroperoxidase family enzyme
MTEAERSMRLPLRSSANTEGETQRVLAKLEKSGNGRTLLRMLANSPYAFRPRVHLADALLHRSAIPRNITEVAILRSAALVDGQYEWRQHTEIARSCGLDDACFDAIAKGDRLSPTLTTEQHLAVRFCDELVLNHDVTDKIWDQVLTTWGAPGACDLLITVAYWAGFTSLITAGLRLGPDD